MLAPSSDAGDASEAAIGRGIERLTAAVVTWSVCPGRRSDPQSPGCSALAHQTSGLRLRPADDEVERSLHLRAVHESSERPGDGRTTSVQVDVERDAAADFHGLDAVVERHGQPQQLALPCPTSAVIDRCHGEG